MRKLLTMNNSTLTFYDLGKDVAHLRIIIKLEKKIIFL